MKFKPSKTETQICLYSQYFLSAAEGQRPRNDFSCCSCSLIFCLIYALSTSTTLTPPSVFSLSLLPPPLSLLLLSLLSFYSLLPMSIYLCLLSYVYLTCSYLPTYVYLPTYINIPAYLYQYIYLCPHTTVCQPTILCLSTIIYLPI